MSERAAAEERPAGQTPGSGCSGRSGTAPSPWLFLRAGLDSPSYSGCQSNNDPQGFSSSTDSVDNSRPPMSRLTAKTLRKAHTMVRHIHRLGGPVPEGLALLERDYNSWRRRVQRGRQRETLLAVPQQDGEDCPWHRLAGAVDRAAREGWKL